jgi:RNA polymerase sigma-70 factor (ECF subfamily)
VKQNWRAENMNTQIAVSETDFKLVSKLQRCTAAEKNEILMMLYERYKNLILKICFHYMKDYDQAQDIFHDAFIKVIENAEKLQNPEVFRSWFVTIARNLCIDRLRKLSYKDREPIMIQAIANRTEDLFVASLERDRLLIHLSDCIDKLDEPLFKILKLRWKGFKAAEISKALRINKLQLRRSYRQIKSILESCMKERGINITIDQIITLAESQGTL